MKLIRDMITTYSQVHHKDKYSQHSSIIWPVWLNGGVFVYKLSGCGFEICGFTKIRLYTILEKSKETVLEFYKGKAKVL